MTDAFASTSPFAQRRHPRGRKTVRGATLHGPIARAALFVCAVILVSGGALAADERIIVFGEYPVVEELGGGRFGEEGSKAPREPFIMYEKGADYSAKARAEALHFLDANVYGYTFSYRPGSALMKTEEVFQIQLRGKVPEGAVIEIGNGVVDTIYRVKLGFDTTSSVQSWRAAFRSNTIRLTESEGTSDFYMGWEGRSDAYRDALKNLVLISARNRLSSKPLIVKGDILVDGNPSFSVGAGRHYCKLQGFVNFVEVVTYD
jgi:hypothetical protein